jgi:hypothetical protein
LRVFEHSTNKSCQTLHTISLCCAHSFSNWLELISLLQSTNIHHCLHF